MLDINNNPWLGLASYQAADSFRFFGREREMEEIGASIKDNYCTILYGVSGAGKTSIINAGLCPKLACEGYVPITIRFDHNGPAYSNQIIEACLNKFKLDGIEFECPFSIEQFRKFDERDVLWLFFHTATFWSNNNQKIVPVLFIDQFEELFTLTKTDKQIESFFQQIDSLFGSVPSERLISSLESENVSFEFSEKSHFRIVLSMREDFLARLEDYCYDLPILRRNRMGLQKMNGLQALDVIMKPQHGLVTKDVALKIVSKVTGKDCQGNSVKLQLLPVDTSILSLFCSELYKLTADKNEDSITSGIVETEGGDIIKHFYEKNVSRLSRRGRKYLEQHLLTSSGFRNQLAIEDINHSLLPEKDIKSLESARIIRKEIINGTERIEFTHDILCKAALESVCKVKERNVRFSSVISYCTSAIVCIYLVKCVYSMISRSLFILCWGIEPHSLFNIVFLVLLFIYGLLYIPLSMTLNRGKNVLLDVLLILSNIILLFIDGEVLYYGLPYTLSRCFALLIIIPIVNLCSRRPRCSFREYIKSIFKFHSIEKNKWILSIIYCSIFWGLLKSLEELHDSFLYLASSGLVVSIACLLASIVIIAFFITLLSITVPSSNRGGCYKKCIALNVFLTAIVFFYLLTQYFHERWTSYISFAALILISLYLFINQLMLCLKDRKYARIPLCVVSVFILCFAPDYVSNINIRSLKDNSRSLDNSGWCVKIVSPDGHYGVMEGSEIIIPPIYKSISGGYNQNGRRYSLFNRDKYSWRLNRILDQIYNHIYGDPACAYRVQDDNGVSSTWNVMEHVELDNRYIRSIPRYLELYPIDPYVARLSVDYYYQRAKVEADARFQEKFDFESERLFFLNFNDNKVDSVVLAFQDRDFFKANYVPESPNTVYNALKRTIHSKAIRSNVLLDNVSKLIDSFSDVEYHIVKVKSRGLLCLIRGNYDEAVNYAKMTSDDETLVKALILSGDSDNTGLIDILLTRSNDDGRFLGEIIEEDIGYLSDNDGKYDYSSTLKWCAALPQTFLESVSIDRTHVRRTLYNGNVLFIEHGKIVSEYDRIVYPDQTAYNFGVYFRGRKRGYIDLAGNELTDAIFDHAWVFSEHNGLAVVEIDGKIGFINANGKYTVLPEIPMQGELRYYKDWIFDADGYLSFPGSERKFGLLDSNGKWFVYPQYGDIEEYNFEFREIVDPNSDRRGLIDRNGEVVIKPEYSNVYVDSKYIEVRDDNYDISFFKHDGGKILGKVLERE